MSYAIIRNANYKKENLAGLYKHNERKNTNYSNKDIIKRNSLNNYSIKNINTTYWNKIKELQQENNLKGRIIKTTNIACEFIVTSDKDFFDTIGQEKTKRYFQTAFDFVANYKNLEKKYILSAKVHMDESTPHMHIVFVPVVQVKDSKGNTINKIACSKYWKGKNSYRDLQDNFYKYITERGFNLERGKQTTKEHLSTEKLKQITNYDNIKYEITQEQILPLETKNTSLILKQNQELITYTNKLKKYLAQSTITTEQVETLKIENYNLKQENTILKKENSKLRNYIERTFEVVTNLFNFPINSLKRIINNCIKEFEK